MTEIEKNESIEALEEKISKFRGSECKVKIDGYTIEVIGSYSHFPEGRSVGTATTEKDAVILNAEWVDNLFIFERIGRLSNCGLSNYGDRKTIEKLLTNEVQAELEGF